MRLGFAPVLDRYAGGIYQYSFSIIEALLNVQAGSGLDVTLYLDRPVTTEDPLPAQWEAVVTNRTDNTNSVLRRLWSEFPDGRLKQALRAARFRGSQDFSIDSYERRYEGEGRQWLSEISRVVPDLMLFAAPDARSLSGTPFIMAIHDLQHRLQRKWPEVSVGGEWEAREVLFRNAARNARAILVDSSVGREDVLDAYASFGLTEDRVWILPFVPRRFFSELSRMTVPDVRARFSLPDSFLFYPAQFWPHKNHITIIRALSLMRQRGVHPPAVVFSGDVTGPLRSSTFAEMKDAADVGGVGDLVTHLDYVADEEMVGLYSEATALIMPTFFGPTNIPVLEAWECGCPVITSGIRGIREQVGDAALLADPESPAELADAIARIITDSELRKELVRRGRERVGQHTQEDFSRTLMSVIAAVR